ncbi:C40 family peptidase [Kitasatospora sp. NBC_01287]|uniref:C40 family peptidase n=1 Tax=Kitasatospora sp. NBC_01287 TaxID=2903573 RepID=UPI0022518ACA|nr:C40 family peptidase [Kitasatospora sp. NBC_01287]MCX4744441.1 C40 family peptidase [Kitasatospora sp. NBC_01287]
MTYANRTGRRLGGWALGLALSLSVATAACGPRAMAAGEVERPAAPRPPAGPPGPPVPRAAAPGAPGEDGRPAPVADPGPAPAESVLHRWSDLTAELALSATALDSLREEVQERHRAAALVRVPRDVAPTGTEASSAPAGGPVRGGPVRGGPVRGGPVRGGPLADVSAVFRLLAGWQAEREEQAREVLEAEDQAVDRLADAEQRRRRLLDDRSELLTGLAERFGDGTREGATDRATDPADEEPDPPAAEAVAFALGRIGSPYVWGAVGPHAFDCSGLTSQAWHAAHLTIPRTSQEQWARLPHLGPGAPLRPGDLVVYFEGATHVGLYLGDGLVVNAPHAGTVVRLTSLHSMPVRGVVRPPAAADQRSVGLTAGQSDG